jgi:addiction module HigA family antidote
MGKAIINEFEPDYAVHPGQILEETLEAQGLSKKEFSERAGLTPKTVSFIISGQAPVVSDNAIVFERILGISAHIWSNIDAEYRLFTARQKAKEGLKSAVAWSKKFPLSDLVKRNVMPSGLSSEQKAGFLLDFFKVRGPEEWDVQYGNITVAFRSSPAFTSNYESVVTWLRLAELRAEKIQTKPYNASSFKIALAGIKTLTNKEPHIFEPKMKKLCSDSGVALVMVSELPKTRLSGATRWLTTDKALIALSLRHKWNDYFWFTFFHEAAHILKHGKNDVHVDEGREDIPKTRHEVEADNFAANFLISKSQYREFVFKQIFTEASVKKFARDIGVAVGIVVGRLQHDHYIDYSWLNNLKAKFALNEN